MGRRKKYDLNAQINKIVEEYTNDVISGTFRIVDTYANFCKEHVKEDSPVADVADDEIIRKTKVTENALVEKQFGNKRSRFDMENVYKPGYYRDGWAVRLNRNALRRNLMIYEKVVYNKRQPYLTHLLENGHDLKNSAGETIGHVKRIPHIIQNGEIWSNACLKKIDEFLKKGGKIKP